MVIKALLGGRDFIALLGYVYYEFDCWLRLKNPYLPLDVHNPTMMQDTQRNLSGEGKAERQQAVKDATEEWIRALKSGRDVELAECPGMRRMLEVACGDILSERRRIGGDWAIAGCLTDRNVRQAVRSTFPSLHSGPIGGHLSFLDKTDFHPVKKNCHE